MVGGDYVPRNLACLAEEGRHVSIAAQRGAKAEIPIWQVMREAPHPHRLDPAGPLGPVQVRLAAELREKVWPRIEAGEAAR
jgi:NADPH2:quinone reductase